MVVFSTEVSWTLVFVFLCSLLLWPLVAAKQNYTLPFGITNIRTRKTIFRSENFFFFFLSINLSSQQLPCFQHAWPEAFWSLWLPGFFVFRRLRSQKPTELIVSGCRVCLFSAVSQMKWKELYLLLFSLFCPVCFKCCSNHKRNVMFILFIKFFS